jgi:histone-lysine N-methyltransferase SETD1
MKDFRKDEMIVEYTGEVIRSVVGDRREKAYEKSGLGGCYMFRLDKDYIVDSSRKGNVARFTNHSCDPNSYVKVVVINGHDEDKSRAPLHMTKKIVFVAKKNLRKGDEMLYDYNFALEDDNEIACNCGAPNCKGRMN